MKKLLPGIVSMTVALFSCSLMAAPGEWWEITAKMEMEGMPFAMPAQATKVCMPKGGESDPNNTQGKDKNCKMTDVKHSGNTVKFKGTCVNQGETMNIVGESSHDANSFKSNVKMTGKSQGRDMNMAMVNSGKRIGGACDTEELGRKMKAQAETQNREMKAQMAQICDTSKYKASDWVNNSANFMGTKPLCTGKQDAMCKVLRNDVPHDLQAFQTLQSMDKVRGQTSPAKVCNIDMTSTMKSLCKARANKGPLSFLEANCPAEAKVYRELERKREECGERGYTSGARMKQCMGGRMIEEEKSESAPPAKSGKHRAYTEEDNPSSDDGSSEAVRQGTKALKGLLGF
jgi:hypothetical protein